LNQTELELCNLLFSLMLVSCILQTSLGNTVTLLKPILNNWAKKWTHDFKTKVCEVRLLSIVQKYKKTAVYTHVNGDCGRHALSNTSQNSKGDTTHRSTLSRSPNCSYVVLYNFVSLFSLFLLYANVTSC